MRIKSKVLGFLAIGTLTLLPNSIHVQAQDVNEKELFITPIESDKFWERMETQKRIPKLMEFLKSKYEGNYAGLYVDQENGGVVNIGFYSIPGEDELSKVTKLLGKDVKVKYNKVKYSRDKLDGIVNELSAIIDNTEDNIVSISTSFSNQKVIIGYTDDEEKAKDQIFSELQSKSLKRSLNNEQLDEELFRFVKTERAETAIDRASIKVRPVSGAVQINFEGTGFCTNGFSAKDKKGNHYLVSAGHCASDVGQKVNQSYKNDNFIGTVEKKIFDWGGSVDVSLVKVSSSLTTPSILTTSGNDYNANGYKIIGEQISDWEGMGVCASLG